MGGVDDSMGTQPLVVPTQETLGHITQTPLPVTYQGSAENVNAEAASSWVDRSRQALLKAREGVAASFPDVSPKASSGPMVGHSPATQSIMADIVVEGGGGQVMKSPQVDAAEVRGNLGLLTPRNANNNKGSAISMEELLGPSLHDGEPLFPSRTEGMSPLFREGDSSPVTKAMSPITKAEGRPYQIPTLRVGSAQDDAAGGGRVGMPAKNGHVFMASTVSDVSGSEFTPIPLSTSFNTINNNNNNTASTTPRNALAYNISPMGLPILLHNQPVQGPEDTPRPPNYDEFQDTYNTFEGADLNPNGKGSGSNIRSIMAASPSGGRIGRTQSRASICDSVEEHVVGRTSSQDSLANRGRVVSDLSKKTLKSAGRTRSLGRVARMSNYDMDPDADSEDKIVTIDCGGLVLRTFLRTLLRHPGTMLWDLAQPGGLLYDDGAMFIDRDFRCFGAILNYYRTGLLEQPADVSDEKWNMELLFFKIENPLFKLPTAEEVELAQLDRGRPRHPGIRQKIWLLWEDPSSSIGAKIIMGFSVILSIVGVVAFVLETDPSFRDDEDESYRFLGFTSSDVRWGLKAFEVSVVMFFTFELCMRFIANDKKREFIRKPMTWCDLIAVCPFYIGLMLDPAVISGSSSIFVRILTLARVLRVVGLVFKLGKYSHGVRVLATTFRTCVMELSILGVLLIMAVIMISSGIYFCENDNSKDAPATDFTSISRSMYFSMISVTTIGYGDMTPKTSCGELVACVAGLSGIFVLGLPISIIGVKFQERYDDMLKEVKIHSERERLGKIDAKLQAMKGMKILSNKILGPRPPESGDLTAQELDTVQRRCSEVFREVDVDQSGEIDVDELGAAMKNLGMEIEKDVLQIIMQAMDDDGSQSVDEAEFLDFVLKCMTGNVQTLSEHAQSNSQGSAAASP